MVASHKLVRIKPANKRESHAAHGVTIKKIDGWCRVPAATADALSGEKMNEMNPDASPDVFDVMDEEEAREIAEAEQVKVEPAGTVDKPRDKTPAEPESAEPKKRTAGR